MKNMVQEAKTNVQEIITRLAKLELDVSFIKDKIKFAGDDMLKEDLRELEEIEEDLLDLEEN